MFRQVWPSGGVRSVGVMGSTRLRPAGVVVRSALIAVRVGPGGRRRCLGLLGSAGGVWAWVLDCNRQLRGWGLRPVVGYQGLCRELADTGVGVFGELGTTGAGRCYAATPTPGSRRPGGANAGDGGVPASETTPGPGPLVSRHVRGPRRPPCPCQCRQGRPAVGARLGPSDPV